jgi:uncharacterized protein (TIGR03435 family)
MTAAQLGAQSPAPLAFEVATVKRSVSPSGVRGGCHGTDSTFPPGSELAAPPLGRCVISDARLDHLVNLAFGLNNMQLIRIREDWVARREERYNVEAKAENPAATTEEQLHAMLQTLLIERFEMKFHREPIETQGFALVVGRNGSKLKVSKSIQESTRFETLVDGRPVGKGKPIPGQPTILTAQRHSIATLASILTQVGQLGPFADRTGLDGVYDYRLAWDPEGGPSLRSALQDQLGLRMEQQKILVSYLVIDSARKPPGN